ncbi:hypothetical protein CDEST_08543 [Colletotrichum destructivum]|uniref:Uncharacterized protein n=1 Tax=Colletotrichum destructivum TaxID=34406 RepID=A0AAX4IKW9_9PEZI|nr:hypothetical protein CDEST_08543 [Colletotrichum destructivum]
MALAGPQYLCSTPLGDCDWNASLPCALGSHAHVLYSDDGTGRAKQSGKEEEKKHACLRIRPGEGRGGFSWSSPHNPMSPSPLSQSLHNPFALAWSTHPCRPCLFQLDLPCSLGPLGAIGSVLDHPAVLSLPDLYDMCVSRSRSHVEPPTHICCFCTISSSHIWSSLQEKYIDTRLPRSGVLSRASRNPDGLINHIATEDSRTQQYQYPQHPSLPLSLFMNTSTYTTLLQDTSSIRYSN